LLVVPIEAASQGYVGIGTRYWAMREGPDGRLIWAEDAEDLASELGLPVERLPTVSAAGVRALVADTECMTCQRPVSLPARESALTTLPTICVDCDEGFLSLIAEHTAPDQVVSYRRQRAVNQRKRELVAREVEKQARALAERIWAERQAPHLPGARPIRRVAQLPFYIAESPMRDAVAALTVLRVEGTADMLGDIGSWAVPFAPTDDFAVDLLHRQRYLEIHPQSPPTIAKWEKSFFDAWHAAGKDPDAMDDPVYLRDDVRYACWYAIGPAGPDLGPAEEALLDHLRSRVDIWRLPDERRTEMIDLALDLLAHELLRAYDHWTHERAELPPLPRREHARFLDAADELLGTVTAGQALTIVWMASSGAVTTRLRTKASPYASVIYGLGRFEHYSQEPVNDAAAIEAALAYIDTQPLSALTNTVFELLGQDPWSVSATSIATGLPPPVVLDDLAAQQTVERLIRMVLADENHARLQMIYQLLTIETQAQHPGVAYGASQLTHMIDLLRDTTGDIRQATATAVAAAKLLAAAAPQLPRWVEIDGELVPTGPQPDTVGDYLISIVLALYIEEACGQA
jgi:hypothetical protein